MTPISKMLARFGGAFPNCLTVVRLLIPQTSAMTGDLS